MNFRNGFPVCRGFGLLTALIFSLSVLLIPSPAYAHTYYGSQVTAEQAAQADAIARHIADTIMSHKELKTDLAKVSVAAAWVAKYAARGKYGRDENKYYRTPYGVFIAGIWSCAGTTRTLGRVLEFMGYEWTHVNENEWLHQWPVLYMDGRIGYADAAVLPRGEAGYGEYEGGLKMVREAKAARGEE